MIRVTRKNASSQTGRHLRRSKYVKNTAYVGPVRPASASRDSDSSTPSGRLQSIDLFYDRMQKYREEYKRFNTHEQQLESEIEAFEDDQEHFLEHLIAIVDAYNTALDSAADFDKVFETSHVEAIGAFMQDYEEPLEEVGILLEPDYHLSIRKFRLKQVFNEDATAFRFIGNQLIPGLFKLFHDLKPAPENIEPLDDSDEYQGRFIDIRG